MDADRKAASAPVWVIIRIAYIWPVKPSDTARIISGIIIIGDVCAAVLFVFIIIGFIISIVFIFIVIIIILIFLITFRLFVFLGFAVFVIGVTLGIRIGRLIFVFCSGIVSRR
jgi:hypothetical protein